MPIREGVARVAVIAASIRRIVRFAINVGQFACVFRQVITGVALSTQCSFVGLAIHIDKAPRKAGLATQDKSLPAVEANPIPVPLLAGRNRLVTGVVDAQHKP